MLFLSCLVTRSLGLQNSSLKVFSVQKVGLIFWVLSILLSLLVIHFTLGKFKLISISFSCVSLAFLLWLKQKDYVKIKSLKVLEIKLLMLILLKHLLYSDVFYVYFIFIWMMEYALLISKCMLSIYWHGDLSFISFQ